MYPMQKKIQRIFIVISTIALIILLRNLYVSYRFDTQPIPESFVAEIEAVEQDVLNNMQRSFGFRYQVPIIITDKIPGKVYGVTSKNKQGQVNIYLNKKVMKESFDYILSDVIAHEYAHALLFKSGYYASGGEGHSDTWLKTCEKLGGSKCQRYVDSHDVIMKKLPF